MPQVPIHFVISAPRSGSTWLAQALNHHPEIFATEHRLFGDFCELWPNNNGKQAPRMTFDAYAKSLGMHYFHNETSDSRVQFIEDFIAAYAQFLVNFAKQRTGKSIIVDKVTPYPGTCEIVLAKIKQFFPDAKLIRLIRDGRDVATSGTFDWLMKDGQGTPRHSHFVESNGATPLARFFDDDVLSKWARQWHEFSTLLPSEVADVSVSYEAMLEDQASELGKIFTALEADASTSIAQSCASKVTFENLTGRQPGSLDATAKQRNGISGDWRNYFTKQDGELFARLAGSELCQEGYESDESWTTNLPDELNLEPTSVSNPNGVKGE